MARPPDSATLLICWTDHNKHPVVNQMKNEKQHLPITLILQTRYIYFFFYIKDITVKKDCTVFITTDPYSLETLENKCHSPIGQILWLDCRHIVFFLFLNKFLLKWHLSANLSGPTNVVNTHGPFPATAPYFELSERRAVAEKDTDTRGHLGTAPALGSRCEPSQEHISIPLK